VRVFVAGATGVIGIRLVPLLVREGHDVTALTRDPAKIPRLTELGATAAVCDVYDRDRLIEVVRATRPDVVVHQLTDLPDDPALLPERAAANNRIRREGTANLLAAAHAGAARRVLAQSVAWELPGDGGAAVREMETAVLDAGGVVIRYGRFYGPGTYFEDALPDPPRIHLDEAARRTVPLLDAATGVVVIAEP